MENKIDCYFKLREAKDIACQLYSISEGGSHKDINKTRVYSAYMLEDVQNLNLDMVVQAVDKLHQCRADDVKQKCETLNSLWTQTKEEYISTIQDVLDIEFDGSKAFDCYVRLQHLPINEIDFANNAIYLDCAGGVEDIFTTFIIIFTKLIVLKVWQQHIDWDFDASYNWKNKIWLFVEIAIDAIFAKTKLSKWCTAPSYKYFYSIKLEGVNIMEQYRKLFDKIHVLDFLDTVYLFVQDNYKPILEFKNYLY